jgi:heme exporter protein A
MTSRQAYAGSVRLENVSVIRGNRLVFSGFSLESAPSDIVWIRGANGSGKSTLLRLIAGLLPCASGAVHVNGEVALADENLALDANMTVEKALRFWAGMDGTSAAMLDAALTAVDMVALADVPVRFLSTGQRKRASLARVVASSAPIWLLDEPYNGLDSASAARLDAALLKHAAAGGMALVAAHQAPSVNVAQSILLDRKQAAT